MTLSTTFQGGLMAELSPFQFSPIQVEMDRTAQGLEPIQLLPAEQVRRCLTNDLGHGRLSDRHAGSLCMR
jgi:hypothetical protein